MAWHGGGCVYTAESKYAAGRRYDAERVARAYGESVRRYVYNDCSLYRNIHLLLAVLPFAAGVAVLRYLRCHCNA